MGIAVCVVRVLYIFGQMLLGAELTLGYGLSVIVCVVVAILCVVGFTRTLASVANLSASMARAEAVAKHADTLPTPTSSARVMAQAHASAAFASGASALANARFSSVSIESSHVDARGTSFTLRVYEDTKRVCLHYTTATTNWTVTAGACRA
jgi:hypothetical protein